MEGAYGVPRGRALSHLGKGNEKKTVRTGAEKRDPTHPTLELFLNNISQNITIDVERRGAMDCRVGFGFTLAIGML